MIDHNDGGDHRHEIESPVFELNELKFISAIGRGAKGVVFLVRDPREEHRLLALKLISKSSLHKNNGDGNEVLDLRRIHLERDVLKQLNHPLLPRLRGILAPHDKLVGYALDYCSGRDLNNLRKKQSEKMFSDDVIRFYAAELVLALEYLHELGIVYRDLKPENILIQENGHLMLVDFDLSTKLTSKSPQPYFSDSSSRSANSIKVNSGSASPNPTMKKRYLPFYFCQNPVTTPEDSSSRNGSSSRKTTGSNSEGKSNSFVGTEEYVAPEIIQGNGHDFSVDWWCLGVVLYEMLYGETPFKGSNRKETFYRVLSKPPELIGEQTALRDLIGKLLEKDAKQRITVLEIKRHEFFRGVNWELILELSRPPFIPSDKVVEDEEGIKAIDVEDFVQSVFSGADLQKKEIEDQNQNNNNKIADDNRGVWVEGLNNPSEADNFFIF
ncbi:Protein kinase domain [Dillenia turbinata]|uniref:non-specific serine/threonine protein kinase n=1 Tax=Dillenia turbinata TaxID=194707 RepID=A0AAN8VY07_9MAGN